MPNISLNLTENHLSTTRPIAMSVIKELKALFSLPDGAQINFPGEAGVNINAGSAIGGNESGVTMDARDLITIEVSEEWPDNFLLTEAVDGEDHSAVFFDPALDVLIKPVYSKSTMTMNIKIKHKDRNGADKLRNQFRLAFQQGRNTNVHEISYHWGIPDVALILLYQIHTLREAQAGYGENLGTWVRKYMSTKATSLLNQAGDVDKALLVMSETQLSVVGYFEFNGQPPKAEFNKDNGTWELNLPYVFTYDKPIAINMRYPLIVHNKILSKDFRNTTAPYELRRKWQTPSIQRVLFDSFNHRRFAMGYAYPGISVPLFDDWLPKLTRFGLSQMMRILIALSPTALTSVCTLTDLAKYSFDADLLAFMLQIPAANMQYGNSIVHVSVYAGDNQMADDKVAMGAGLHISALQPLSLRNHHHVLVSLVTDFGVLTEACKERLQLQGALALKYFTILDPEFVNSYAYPKSLTPLGHITISDWRLIRQYFDERSSRYYDPNGYSKRATGNFVIVAASTVPSPIAAKP